MSTELKLSRIITTEPLTCFSCSNLGLPPDGIAPNTTCIEIISEAGRVSYSCEDCFARLDAEIAQMKEQEDSIDSGFDSD